jgi:aromatic-L-amino-acid/L-tryptophan decarboxylase
MNAEPADMHPDELRRHGHAVADWVADFLAGIEERPVFPKVTPGEVLAQLSAHAPEDGEPMEEILADVDRILLPAMTHWNHPGFHAYFANTGSGPGILAETMIAAINDNAMLWRTGPAATELELRVCDWIRQMIGLPAGFEGHIEDTASTSTLVALAAARHRATAGAVRDRGLAGGPVLRVYCSEEAHSSVERAAIVLGLGTEGCRRIDTDAQFRMRPELLAAAIGEDRARGIVPMAVVATAGTTSTTSVDPVAAIAAVCERVDLWLHVDAAYGGSMAVSERFRWVLDGCDRAHSLVINPHKWLFVPMDCSVLLTREPSALRAAFSLVPPYLMTPEDGIARNLMDYGVALGRRFRALKLWFVLRWFGRRRLAALIERHVELATRFAGWVEDDPHWEVLAPAPMSTVLFRHVPRPGMGEEELKAHNQTILERINEDGRSFLSHTELRAGTQKRYALRLAIGNARTLEQHVGAAWDRLRAAAGERATNG